MPHSPLRSACRRHVPHALRASFATLLVMLALPARLAPAQQTPAQPASEATTAQHPAAQYREQAIERWSEEIARLDQRNAEEPAPEDGILFIGSSSIKLWKTIAEDVAPYEAIERGYGGAQFSDLAVFAEHIIHPHQYQALVMFVANDVLGQPSDKSPEEIERLVRYIIGVSRRHQPEAPVFLVEITPTASRLAAWPQIRKVNSMMRELALTEPHVHFIATAEHYLDPETNRPIDRLFVEDRLHLSREGYHVWAKLIRRRLDDVLGQLPGGG